MSDPLPQPSELSPRLTTEELNRLLDGDMSSEELHGFRIRTWREYTRGDVPGEAA